MKRLFLPAILFTLVLSQPSYSQCPTPGGMVGVPLSLSGNCFVNVQFAIPNSNVSVYNASGFVAQATANSSGNAVIFYPCASAPITSILSILSGTTPQICNQSVITQPAILPVKLVSFAVSFSERKTALLTWETAFELNNEKYEIEKSADGINYTSIAVLNGQGDGIGKKTYTYDDRSFTPGSTAFYRLKQTDYNGQITFSKIVYISDKTSATGEYSLFPNPVSGSGTIQVKGLAASQVTYGNIRIINIAGREVKYRITGANTIEMDPAAPSGIYLVKIKDKTLKLIKK
jgi:hypothetical protein